MLAVHALDAEELGPDATATPAEVGFTMFGKTLARALIIGVHEQ